MIDRRLNYGPQVVARLAASLPHAPKSVLDLGAGGGRDLLSVKRIWPGVAMYGIDYLDAHVESLRRQGVHTSSLNLERDRLPFDNTSVDLIIANQVLEHMKEIFWAFHEISRILPIGGHAIIGVPNLASLHNRVLLLFGRQPSVIKANSAHVRGFSKHDFERFLACFPGGYRLLKHSGANFYPFPPALANPLAKLLPSLSWGMFLLLRKERPYADEFLTFPVKENLETNYYLGK